MSVHLLMFMFVQCVHKAPPVLTQRVHLQLLSQADLLQTVIEVGLWAAASGGRQSEDTHDLPLVSK